ncbi:caspase family protein [Leptolyngbya sp. AN02str]|uniref:caspase family protein n=1 Tax=Leptolyngbya sp. AN02str TaxID=3423363 RepID=UPI003D3191EE
MNHIYALLVGIDRYDRASSISPLKGCVNDVKAFQSYLEGQIVQHTGQLHLKVLLNEQATRQAVIDGFRQHLCQAGPEDVALFFYAGHGSQEKAPEEFWHAEPDRLNETLVCYDSRCDGSWDLADKELAKLIGEVTAKSPHTVAIIDSCHSGTATRGDSESTQGVRRIPVDPRQRPLSSFIVNPAELPTTPRTRSFGEPTSGWYMPQGRHVLIAACRDFEEAKEYASNGEHHGAFSCCLLDTLSKVNGSLTYRDVFKRVSALVQSRVTDQLPQLEAIVANDLDRPFLGGAIQPRSPHFSVSYHSDYGWTLDGGSIHGIAQPTAGETTTLNLFPFNSSDEVIQTSHQPIGTAVVTTVMPGLSLVQITGVPNLQPDMTFKAVVTSLPLPPLGVYWIGDADGLARLQHAIAHANNTEPSLYIRPVEDPTAATFQVLAQNNQYAIKRPADARILLEPVLGYTVESARETIRLLEHLARWTTTLELQSSPTSRIASNAVQMEIVQPNQTHSGDNIRLTYTNQTPPKFQLKLKNTSDQRLYCTVLDLTERFAIHADLFKAGGQWLAPGEEAYALSGKPIDASVPDELWEQGITEFKDVLKLIVSTSEFDARLLEQDKLTLYQGEPRSPEPRTTRSSPKGMLNRLMQRVQTRDLGASAENEVTDDWITSQMVITTVRPRHAIALSAATPKAQLIPGVTIESPADFQAQARLTTIPQSTRDLGNHILPLLLRDRTQSFQFTASRATDPGLSALELSHVNNRETITPQNPLKVIADRTLEQGTYILPVAYDGEFYLPLGRGIAQGDQTEITIEHLPEPIQEGNRSLGGAIRIFFQKVVSQKLGSELSQKFGIAFDYPILAAVAVNDGEVSYDADPIVVAAKVAQAKRIALYTHGIIGDTASMLPSIDTAMVRVNEQAKPLKNCYDLILAFDYESLNTPIATHARELKQRLKEIGLGPNHDKTFHIIAHSMGGLVSRWFIEQEGGNEVVQHLILLGTPSAGSPWPQVEAGITTLAALIINGLSTVAVPLRILGSLLEHLESMDMTLDEMEPSSEFLKALAMSDDPGVSYTVIAGNTSLIHGTKGTLAEKLVARIKSLMELPFFGVTNDLAVTVESIQAIPTNRTPAPTLVEVDCDHLVYFTEPSGVTALGTSIQTILAGEMAATVSMASTSMASTMMPPVPAIAAMPQPQHLQLQATPSQHEQTSQSVFVWWLLGAIALILFGLFGLRLLQQPTPTPANSQSQSLAETIYHA